VQIVRDDVLWERLSHAGRNLMLANGSSAAITAGLRELLSASPQV
jgi:hypothetical protein